MRLFLHILPIWLGTACAAMGADTAVKVDVAVTLHDSHGLSAESAREHVLEIVLFKAHTHFHFKISNITDHPLILWRPHCPEGDDAMGIEFREPGMPDKVWQARASLNYTGGMGIPKVFTLAPGDDLIVNVDFLGEWVLPFNLEADQIREMEVRAVYRSQRLTRGKLLGTFAVPKEMEGVWVGTSASTWQKVRIINRTGEKMARAK